jgi:hypothetical protein
MHPDEEVGVEQAGARAMAVHDIVRRARRLAGLPGPLLLAPPAFCEVPEQPLGNVGSDRGVTGKTKGHHTFHRLRGPRRLREAMAREPRSYDSHALRAPPVAGNSRDPT